MLFKAEMNHLMNIILIVLSKRKNQIFLLSIFTYDGNHLFAIDAIQFCPLSYQDIIRKIHSATKAILGVLH